MPDVIFNRANAAVIVGGKVVGKCFSERRADGSKVFIFVAFDGQREQSIKRYWLRDAIEAASRRLPA